jgi:TetR/AcrR family transcriptional repressor of mexJK operon
MDKIAQTAPVSKATLYRYFSSKDYLLVAVIDELCANLWQTIDEIFIDTSSIETNLKKIASAFMDLIFSKQGIGIYRLVVAECHNFPKLGQLVYQTAPKNMLSQLEKYLTKIDQQNDVKITNINFAAEAFFSLLKGELHFQCLLEISPLPSETEKKKHINQVVTFFMQGWLK